MSSRTTRGPAAGPDRGATPETATAAPAGGAADLAATVGNIAFARMVGGTAGGRRTLARQEPDARRGGSALGRGWARAQLMALGALAELNQQSRQHVANVVGNLQVLLDSITEDADFGHLHQAMFPILDQVEVDAPPTISAEMDGVAAALHQTHATIGVLGDPEREAAAVSEHLSTATEQVVAAASWEPPETSENGEEAPEGWPEGVQDGLADVAQQLAAVLAGPIKGPPSKAAVAVAPVAVRLFALAGTAPAAVRGHVDGAALIALDAQHTLQALARDRTSNIESARESADAARIVAYDLLERLAAQAEEIQRKKEAIESAGAPAGE